MASLIKVIIKLKIFYLKRILFYNNENNNKYLR